MASRWQQRRISRQLPQLETDPGGDTLNKQRREVTARRPSTLRADRRPVFFGGCARSFLLQAERMFGTLLSGII